MAQEVFAFGDMTVQGTPCVAKSCGYSAAGELLTVAERYDTIVQQRYGIDEGILPRDIAESCWNEAIEDVDSWLVDERDPDHARYLSRSIEAAKAVSDEAF